MATYTYTILTSPPDSPTARLASVTGTIPAGPVIVDFWFNPDDKVTYTITECNPVFSNQPNITSVSMPYVTNILANSPTNDTGICQGCTALTSFSAPQLQQLNCINGFQGCTSLTWGGLNLGSITSIPNNTFNGCTSFSTNIDITSSTSGIVTSIGTYAFANIPNLSSTNLYLGSVTSLSDGMFYNSGTNPGTLININLATLSSVPITQLGNSVFQGCTRLSIFLGASLTSIGTDVFNTCTSLTTITPFGLGAVTAIPARTFFDCTSLTDVTFQNMSSADITSIGDNAFQGCTSMTIFDGRFGIIPSGIKTLGTGVFYGCTSLNQARLGAVSVIPAQTFFACSTLTTWTGIGILNLSAGALSDLNITSIGSEAFYSCTSIQSVVGTSFLSSIGTAAFKLCSNLTTVSTLGTITSVPDELFNQTSIGKSGVSAGPVDLANIFINPITSLGNSVFYNCVWISSFTGSALTSIGTDTFAGCSALTSVNLGAINALPDRTFNVCVALPKINLALISTNAITTLGNNVFYYCAALTSFSGPSVTTMGQNVFYFCNSLTKFFLGAQSPPTFTSPLFIGTPLNYVCFDSRYSANWEVGVAPYLYDGKTLTAYQRINITAPSTAFQNAQQLVTVVETGGAPPFGVPSLGESANWYKNNSPIPGEQSPSLIILQATPAADYQYIIQNDFEKVYSDIFGVDNYITANRFTIMYRPVILPPQPYF